MRDQLARKYDYYTVAPEVSKPKKQYNKKKLSKIQFMKRRNAQIRLKQKMELRKKFTLTIGTILVTFGVLGFAMYIFLINGVL